MSPVVHVEGSVFQSLMVCIIDCKLNLCQMLIPIILSGVYVVADHVFNDPVHALSLPVCSGVVCCTEALFDVPYSAQFPEESGRELCTSVSHKGTWQTMMSVNMVHKQLSGFYCIAVDSGWH